MRGHKINQNMIHIALNATRTGSLHLRLKYISYSINILRTCALKHSRNKLAKAHLEAVSNSGNSLVKLLNQIDWEHKENGSSSLYLAANKPATNKPEIVHASMLPPLCQMPSYA